MTHEELMKIGEACAEGLSEGLEDDKVWGLTPWGCMYAILQDYGFNPEQITPKMGEHMVEDFMEMMVKAGIVRKKEQEDK